MSKNKIITCITLIITIILSILFISYNTKGLSIEELQNIINNPTTNTSVLKDRYELLYDYWMDIRTDSKIQETDSTKVDLFKQAATAVMQALSSAGPGYSSYVQDLKDWISGADNIIATDVSNVQDLVNIRDTTSTDYTEVQKRYSILEKWYHELIESWQFEPNKDLTNVQVFRQAVKNLQQYGASQLTGNQNEVLNRWAIAAEDIIIRQGGSIQENTTPSTGTYNDIKPSFRLSVGTTFEFDGYHNDNGYVVPTSMNINGHRYHIYCVDHGSSPGSRLRTRSIKQDSWYDGYYEEYCRRDDCDEGNDIDSSEKSERDRWVSQKTKFYSRPIMKVTRAYDITGADDRYQYVGYMLDHVVKQPENSGLASWVAQNALWVTDINRGSSGIENASDDFESSASAITKSELINELTHDEADTLTSYTTQVQESNDRPTLQRVLSELIKHYEDKAQEAASKGDQEMRQFYWDVVYAPDGLAGVLNWVNTQPTGAYISDLKANVYQYLMTIDSSTATNIKTKLENKAKDIADSLNDVSSGEVKTLIGAGALASEGYAFQEFYEELKANKGELKVENKTGNTDVLVDRNTGTYTIGPFKVQYNDKFVRSSADTAKRVNFAEIVSIKLYNRDQLYKTYCVEHIDPETKQLIPAKQEFKITKTSNVWEMDNGYVFPKSNEPFYIILDSDKQPSATTIDPNNVRIEIEFNYIAYYVAELYRTGDTTQTEYQWTKRSIKHHYQCSGSGKNCPHTYRVSAYRYTFKKVNTSRLQEQLLVGYTDEIRKKKVISISVYKPIRYRDDTWIDRDDVHYDEITMSISGKVFWDQNEGKESKPDGQYDASEPLLKNIEVSLYEYDEATGQSVLATLAPAKPDSKGKVEIRSNPTLTDKDGNYVFYGVRPLNKYYIQFKYNGQIYQATTYSAQSEEHLENTGEKEDIEKDNRTLGRISNAKEFQTEDEKTQIKVNTAIARETYNNMFSTIGSAPYNYTSTNSLNYGVSGRTYTQKELMGYKLVNNGDGTYKYNVDNSVVQLLDEVTPEGQLREGIINKKINEYIYGVGGTLSNPTAGAHGTYPNLKTDIYDSIVSEYQGRDPEIKDKLQFIEDIYMTADTAHGKVEGDQKVLSLLSKYDRFAIGNNECVIQKGQYLVVAIDGTTVEWTESLKTTNQGRTTVTYHNLYSEQNNINLGLNERPTTDIALRSDVKEVTLEINGKTHVYDYDTRKASDESNGDTDTWEIGVRLSDVGGGMKYYDQNYSRELYKSDYLYKASNYNNGENTFEKYGKSKSDELEVYVTYKITVMNQSMSINTSIDEIVDYFDEDYEYVPERSYYTLSRRNTERDRLPLNAEVGNSAYGDRAETTITGYENLYIKGLKGQYLQSGQTAYIYVTFRVEKDHVNNEDWIKLDEDEVTANPIGVGKENIAEINGYSTIYANGVMVPNVSDSVQSKPAGITDTDSDPGNIDPSSVPKDGEIDYLSFEDDTDKAPNIRIVLYRDHDREVQGLVWEDARTENIMVDGTATDSGARVGDGIMQDGETKINGVTVQLVELMDNGTEFIWRTFERGSGTANTTPAILATGKSNQSIVSNYDFGENKDGQYAFKSFAPGNYVIRFIYGDTVRTVLVNSALTSSGDLNTVKEAQIAGQLKALYKQVYGEDIDGLNAKSYNGQDFKSTTYQEQIEQNGTLEVREDHTYNVGTETLGRVLKTIKSYDKEASNQNESGTYYYDISASDARADVSDAKDIYTNGTMKLEDGANNMKQTNSNLNTRSDVIDYSDTNLTNHIAEVLASFRERPQYTNTENQDTSYSNEELKALIDELMARTQMTAETGVIDIELEYNVKNTANQTAANTSTYQLYNVNLGLEERPKSQLEIEKEVTNVKVTLSDDSVLFDTGERATNVLWQQHEYYKLAYANTNLLDTNYFGNIERIRNNNSSKFGVVQLSMDEEIMHGATIEITYKITIRNVGEADYNDTRFYYTGVVKDPSKIIKTTPNQVVDYVANNLQFNENDNRSDGWHEIKADELLADSSSYSKLINSRLEAQIKEYNTIITTEAFATPLIPTIYKEKTDGSAQDQISKTLVLTQLISPENEQDDLSYRNIVEIVRTSNEVGRKNEYSVVGNQDPRLKAQELDSDLSEDVKILPPFGSTPTYYTLWIAMASVLAIGIGFIVFKVLRKKSK